MWCIDNRTPKFRSLYAVIKMLEQLNRREHVQWWRGPVDRPIDQRNSVGSLASIESYERGRLAMNCSIYFSHPFSPALQAPIAVGVRALGYVHCPCVRSPNPRALMSLSHFRLWPDRVPYKLHHNHDSHSVAVHLKSTPLRQSISIEGILVPPTPTAHPLIHRYIRYQRRGKMMKN